MCSVASSAEGSRSLTPLAPRQCEPLNGKVQKILTWRWKEEPAEEKPADGEAATSSSPKKKPQRLREYFVKYHEKSYWHCDWVSELQVRTRGRVGCPGAES